MCTVIVYAFIDLYGTVHVTGCHASILCSLCYLWNCDSIAYLNFGYEDVNSLAAGDSVKLCHKTSHHICVSLFLGVV